MIGYAKPPKCWTCLDTDQASCEGVLIPCPETHGRRIVQALVRLRIWAWSQIMADDLESLRMARIDNELKAAGQ